MGPRALLLSPDDQAVNAITGVLEEMSVSCERPLDGATAAKKLNSERFDLVLVDCDNLPAAKLIFDVCRRSHGTSVVPVAIVDGRVGLPTAFRLGAELILTKPVAKDQARITVRTAVGRIKKDQPHPEAKPENVPEAKAENGVPPAEASHEASHEGTAPKMMAMAAAAGAGFAAASSPVVNVPSISIPSPAIPEPLSESAKPDSVAASLAVASAAAAARASVISSAAAEIFETKPPTVRPPEPEIAAKSPTSLKTEPVSTPKTPQKEPAPPRKEIVEDPVMKPLEKKEPSLPSPIFSSYEQPKPRGDRGRIATVLFLAIAGGGFYAAWMYQPGFREFVQARLSQANAFFGPEIQKAANVISKPGAPAAAKPAPATAPAAQFAPAATAQTQTAPAAAPSANATQAPVSGPDASTPVPTTPSNPAVNSTPAEDQKKIDPPASEKASSSSSSESDFPEAKNAVILSSKGAEKRLLHRVAPVLPKAHSQSPEATVVLKAVIDESGAVQAIHPVEGDPVLADAATKAVKQWRYKPFLRDGKVLPFQTIILVDFQ